MADGDDYSTRWMTHGDTLEVLGIESTLAVPAWTREDFEDVFEDDGVFGRVAVRLSDNRVVGYVVMQNHRRRVEIIRLVVAKPFRRQGVGTLLMMDIAMRLSNDRRPYLRVDVPEECLDMQLFLRHHGIRCVETVEDGNVYRFKHRVPQPMEVEE